MPMRRSTASRLNRFWLLVGWAETLWRGSAEKIGLSSCSARYIWRDLEVQGRSGYSGSRTHPETSLGATAHQVAGGNAGVGWGNLFLEISAGSSHAPAVVTGATSKGIEPTDFSALLELARGTIVNLDNTVRNANSLTHNARC